MSVFSRNINVSRVLQGNSWREVCPSRVNRRIGNPTYGGVRAGGREAPGYSLQVLEMNALVTPPSAPLIVAPGVEPLNLWSPSPPEP